MSEQKPEKKNDPNESFSIGNDEWNGEIPGVTRLLSRSEVKKAFDKLNQKAPEFKEKTAMHSPSNTKMNVVAPPSSAAENKKNSLADLGVHFEHQFKITANELVFSNSVKHHSNVELQAWQKAILEHMKFDTVVFAMVTDFHEYPLTNTVMSEIFACAEPSFIQIIQPANASHVVVLQSQASLAAKKDEVMVLVTQGLITTNDPNQKNLKDDSMSIELDLAS